MAVKFILVCRMELASDSPFFTFKNRHMEKSQPLTERGYSWVKNQTCCTGLSFWQHLFLHFICRCYVHTPETTTKKNQRSSNGEKPQVAKNRHCLCKGTNSLQYNAISFLFFFFFSLCWRFLFLHHNALLFLRLTSCWRWGVGPLLQGWSQYSYPSVKWPHRSRQWSTGNKKSKPQRSKNSNKTGQKYDKDARNESCLCIMHSTWLGCLGPLKELRW